jgi:SAM-dependent methyltransferase
MPTVWSNVDAGRWWGRIYQQQELIQPADQARATYDIDEAVDRLRADFDATPYNSISYPQSPPGQLAAVAYLFGLETPEVSSARVLEIGCAAGGNVIPFAAAHPHARVVGIDLSPAQIDQGRLVMQALGLSNVELLAGDIASMDLTSLGQFDFIIAHGVYSWVPAEVRRALVRVPHVAGPDGVAYMSYNVYPGMSPRKSRDAMLLTSGASATPEEKARAARGMVDFLEEVVPADGGNHGFWPNSGLTLKVSAILTCCIDELAAFNRPCYFYEMVGHAGAHGLAYRGEARPEAMCPANYGPRGAEHLLEKCGGVQVLVEQYIDFVVNRTFRESLLVHADRAPQIRYNPDGSRLRRLHIAAYIPPAEGQTRIDNSRQEYSEPDGATLFTNDPGIKAALDALSDRWPWTLSRQELVDAVHARLVSAGLTPSEPLPDPTDKLMGVVIL